MSYKLKLQPNPSTIWVGIPTGFTKEYSFLYMLAALRNVDYNPNYMKIVFAVSDYEDENSRTFIENVKELVEHSGLLCKTEVITTTHTEEEYERWQAYTYVCKNMEALQKKFLTENYNYFWILGGDNPPPRTSLKRLLKLDADIASGLLYQRPIKQIDGFGGRASVPLVFKHIWTLQHLENNGLNSEQKRLLRKAWVDCGFMRYLCLNKNWRRYKILRNVVFGDACCLVKRKVFEKVKWEIPAQGYQSPDIQWIQVALAEGFSTAIDMKLHCPHLEMDGKAY